MRGQRLPSTKDHNSRKAAAPAHVRYVCYKLCDYTLWTEPEHAPRIGRMQAAQKKLGKRIATLRNQKRISQEAFAARCQINRVHMSAIERGKVNLTIATLRKIARNLDTTISALLKGIL